MIRVEVRRETDLHNKIEKKNIGNFLKFFQNIVFKKTGSGRPENIRTCEIKAQSFCVLKVYKLRLK